MNVKAQRTAVADSEKKQRFETRVSNLFHCLDAVPSPYGSASIWKSTGEIQGSVWTLKSTLPSVKKTAATPKKRKLSYDVCRLAKRVKPTATEEQEELQELRALLKNIAQESQHMEDGGNDLSIWKGDTPFQVGALSGTESELFNVLRMVGKDETVDLEAEEDEFDRLADGLTCGTDSPKDARANHAAALRRLQEDKAEAEAVALQESAGRARLKEEIVPCESIKNTGSVNRETASPINVETETQPKTALFDPVLRHTAAKSTKPDNVNEPAEIGAAPVVIPATPGGLASILKAKENEGRTLDSAHLTNITPTKNVRFDVPEGEGPGDNDSSTANATKRRPLRQETRKGKKGGRSSDLLKFLGLADCLLPTHPPETENPPPPWRSQQISFINFNQLGSDLKSNREEPKLDLDSSTGKRARDWLASPVSRSGWEASLGESVEANQVPTTSPSKPSSRVPDHVKNPHKYTYYSLEFEGEDDETVNKEGMLAAVKAAEMNKHAPGISVENEKGLQVCDESGGSSHVRESSEENQGPCKSVSLKLVEKEDKVEEPSVAPREEVHSVVGHQRVEFSLPKSGLEDQTVAFSTARRRRSMDRARRGMRVTLGGSGELQELLDNFHMDVNPSDSGQGINKQPSQVTPQQPTRTLALEQSRLAVEEEQLSAVTSTAGQVSIESVLNDDESDYHGDTTIQSPNATKKVSRNYRPRRIHLAGDDDNDS